MLGKKMQIYMNTPNLEVSEAFWKKLGYYTVEGGKFWLHMTDEQVSLLLNESNKPEIGLLYYNRDLETLSRNLTAKGFEHQLVKGEQGDNGMLSLVSPNGLNIKVTDFNPDLVYQPPHENIDTFKEMKLAAASPFRVCGKFVEFAHNVEDLNRSLEFWNKMGFMPLTVQGKPYMWAIMSDKLVNIGLHQYNHIKSPTITYFSPGMAQRIEDLKAKGVEGFTPLFKESHMALETPEGQQIFLMSFADNK